MQRAVELGLAAALMVQLSLVLGATLGGVWRAFDLINHMAPWGLAVAFAGLGLALGAKRPPFAAFFAVCAAVGLWRVWPASAPEVEGPTTRLLVANVLRGNPDADALLAWIEAEDPDVIALMEVNDRWVEALAPLGADYPFQALAPREDHFGLAIYARRFVVVTDPEVHGLTPTIAVRTEDDLRLVLTHPIAPISQKAADARDEQLRQLAPLLKDPHTVVVGDLNATPWSHAFPAAVGARPGTWPTWLPGPMRIPIDHVLLSPDLALRELRTGPNFGSDHLGLVADIGRPAAGQSARRD
jgi:endonuclease/exonuclease/phosphatase (EEP) superfamily protein YafD